jgi:D-sedoheptulose 7-phosphate isomerase
MPPMRDWIASYIQAQKDTFNSVPVEAIATVIETFRRAWREDRRIFVFGNGGSAANASHLSVDLGKGSSDKLPKRFRVMSLCENMAWLTALGNDYSYERVFLGQLKNFAEPGDIVLVMSVSGNSPNLVKAVEWSRQNGLHTIALVGAKRGRLAELADQVVVVDSTHYGRVEDAHMFICHIVCYAFMEVPELAGG